MVWITQTGSQTNLYMHISVFKSNFPRPLHPIKTLQCKLKIHAWRLEIRGTPSYSEKKVLYLILCPESKSNHLSAHHLQI